uniref:Protein kinase domain-containing protein n=1 Tax=Acrobeloides nanus TaxID=290746 RepID=A0A914CJY2_9BILA
MPSGYFRTNEGEKIRLGRPVFRNQYSGRFGYGEVVKLQKDEYTTTNVFIRSLRPCFTSMNDVQVELEKLIDLKCRHLVAFQDFQVYEVGHKIPPIILARYTWYEGNLFDYLKNLKYPMGTSKYILWCYQAGKALSYLSGLGFFHRRLCPRACQLDFNENLKISDYWTDKDIEDTPLFQKIDTTNPLSENLGMHRDGWRFLPPETILSNLFTSSSQVWNYALLIWQIFTHCRFANRIHYASLADFLAAKLEDDPFYMPGALSRTEANQGLPERRRRMLAFYKACEKFPSSPKAFNYMIPKCLKKNPDERSTWTELFSVVDAEYRISKLSFSLSKVI